MSLRAALVQIAWLALTPVAMPAAAQTTLQAALEANIHTLQRNGALEIMGEVVTAASGTVAIYAAEDFRPLWTNQSLAAELSSAIAGAEADGLQPAHYHAATIAALARAPASVATSAQLELLRTHALLELTRDLRYGRARALRASFTREPPIDPAADSTVAMVRRMIASGRLAADMRALRPDHFVYRGLVAALADLRRVRAAGGWRQLPEGSPLHPDSMDARVPLLRARLAAEGYAVARAMRGDSMLDAGLAAAVRLFQHRHGLNDDGIVGPRTLAELNVPVETRIQQVRTNLERARWVTHGLPATFLVVNIAGAKAYLIRDDSALFEARAIVGASATRTPVFRAVLRSVDLNPTWTVPPGIVGEVLAEVRRDPSYLRRNAMRVLDASGRAVDPARIDFDAYSGRTFPWVFRQEPGPTNPLGRIKFVFPNPWNVYLHDTPAKELFTREERLFSHGCIRLQDPLDLAPLVLGANWSRAAIDAALAAGRTRAIEVPAPLPVLVLYWTAAADLHGELHYYRDVYDQDERVLHALDRR